MISDLTQLKLDVIVLTAVIVPAFFVACLASGSSCSTSMWTQSYGALCAYLDIYKDMRATGHQFYMSG